MYTSARCGDKSIQTTFLPKKGKKKKALIIFSKEIVILIFNKLVGTGTLTKTGSHQKNVSRRPWNKCDVK